MSAVVRFLLLTCYTKLKCRIAKAHLFAVTSISTCHILGAGTLNGHSSKKRKKQSDADLPQPGGMQGDAEQAAASLPSHGSLLAQTGVLHLLESLLQVALTSIHHHTACHTCFVPLLACEKRCPIRVD